MLNIILKISLTPNVGVFIVYEPRGRAAMSFQRSGKLSHGLGNQRAGMLPWDLVYRKMFGFVEEKQKPRSWAWRHTPLIWALGRCGGRSGLVSSRTNRQTAGGTHSYSWADLELTLTSTSQHQGWWAWVTTAKLFCS